MRSHITISIVFASSLLISLADGRDRRIQSLSPKLGPPSTAVEITSHAFSALEVVRIEFDGVDVGGGVADSNGTFRGLFNVPDQARPGRYDVVCFGTRNIPRFRDVFLVTSPWRQAGGDAWRTRENRLERVLSRDNISSLGRRWRVDLGQDMPKDPMIFHHHGLQVTGFTDGTRLLNPQDGQQTWHLMLEDAVVTSLGFGDIFDRGGLVGFNPQPDPPEDLLFVPLLNGRLIAFDGESSSRVWDVTLGQLGAAPLVLAPIGRSDVRLIVGDLQGTLSGLNQDGHTVWNKAVGSAISFPPIAYGGPDAYGGPNANVAVVGDNDIITALDLSNGVSLWTAPAVRINTPLATDGNQLYFGNNVSSLIALETRDGGQSWAIDVGRKISQAPAISLGDSGAPTRIVVGQDGGLLTAIEDGRTPRALWETNMGAPLSASPILSNGMIVALLGDGSVKVFDIDDGSLLWSTALGGTPVGALIADGMLFCATGGGAISAYGL